MRPLWILFLIAVLISPALADHEMIQLGPYNVSFDMNTTANYGLIRDEPSGGITYKGIPFVRFNLSIDGEEGFAVLVLTKYNESMVADATANMGIVQDVLATTGCEKPQLFRPSIDGKPGALGSCRFPSGDILVSASYSPDGTQQGSEYLGKTNVRVLSTFPWEITRDMLYTLVVKP
ncbi:MAG: hypothetical protein LUQ22_06605 [Methanotrichaceae archaeon]|nr:hypothetical protein [Methanotrichaceae archaeon]